MTREEFGVIVKGLRSVYSDPKYIADKDAFDVWYALLKDLPYEVATMATQAYMQTETFPPKPADIRRYAQKITAPKTEDMSEIEAWGLVRKAIGNSIYNAESEFERLPEIIRQTLGNPARLREMAQTDIADVETVEASNFMRSYRAKLESHKKSMQLNEGLRIGIDELRTTNTPVLEVHEVERKGIEIKEREPIPPEIQIELDALIGRKGG